MTLASSSRPMMQRSSIPGALSHLHLMQLPCPATLAMQVLLIPDILSQIHVGTWDLV